MLDGVRETTHKANSVEWYTVLKRKLKIAFVRNINTSRNFFFTKMYLWVLLNDDKKVLIPINWCEISDKLRLTMYNNGAIGHKIEKLFYSSHDDVDANFDLEISEVFIENIDACNNGKILDCFATIEEAELAGVIENVNNRVDDIDDDTADVKEEDEEEQKKKREEEIEFLEKAATLLRQRLGTNDILDGELNDFQDILNDGNDHFGAFGNDRPSTSGISSNQTDNIPTANGRTFDALSGYMEFAIAVSDLL